MTIKRHHSKLHFALGATVAGGLAFTPTAGMADANPFQVAELESGYMVADSHQGEEGQCAGKSKSKEKAKEGECASKDKDKDKDKDKEQEKGEGGKCAGA